MSVAGILKRCRICVWIDDIREELSRMAYKITDECTMCGTCLPECPFEAISEGDPKYVIDPDVCTDCGACESVCPAEAIAEG